MTQRAGHALVAALLAVLVALLLSARTAAAAERTLVQLAEEVSIGLLEEVNGLFARDWQERTGERVRFRLAVLPAQRQARALAAGLTPDFASARALTDAASPAEAAVYATTIVFLARTARGREARDWGDLLAPQVRVLAADPRRSDVGRWSYLAAWSWALEAAGGDREAALARVRALYRKAELLRSVTPATARDFLRRGRQDVLLWYESEAHELAGRDSRAAVRTPPVSLRVETAPLVPAGDGDGDALRHAYLELLDGPLGREAAARHHFRGAAAAETAELPALRLATVEEHLGGWQRVEEEHFAPGGLLERVLAR
ncbi:substrate-binding domain-containing protein [Marinimicrococcus flavescens]|uniref:Substrate-binding domain-containing protein n=1 Tax=Marinimicrococcus flavescens TaxID=3031815 RepID=A0AAP3XQH6_9PROT|nr:substrate-binding domain-containing protein [Marinimicrococcus flavescens]